MSHRSWLDRIHDILSSVRSIQRYAGSMPLADFLEDDRTIRAVAFEFITIGEAARSIPADVQNEFPQIPWTKMQGIRNLLVHEYFRMDEEILWNTIQDDLPGLISGLESIIQSSSQ